MGNKFVNLMKTRCDSLIVLLSITIYTIVWSNIVILRLDTLNALWADLGIAMERGWLIYNNNWGLNAYLYVFFNSGILYITFPLTLPHNYELLLIFQTIMIGGTAYPIYKISKKLLHNRFLPVLFAMLYLIYFPVSGINWYDFHYQSLFPILFLSGYYLYLTKQTKLSLVFLTFASMVKFPYAVFSTIFSLTILWEILFKNREENRIELSKFSYPLALMLMSISLLFGAYFINGNIGYVQATIGYSVNSSFTADFTSKIFTIFLVFLPTLFVPLLSKKITAFFLPYFALIIFVGGYGKIYPTAFHYQYTSMIVPFVFLGLIEFFNDVRKLKKETFKKLRIKVSYRYLERFIVTLIVFMTILTATLFEPYGPLNHQNFDNFGDFNNYVASDNVTVVYLNQVINLIPKDNNSVLTQFNIPEIYPREPVINTFPNEIYMLIAGHSALSQMNNLTLNNVINNSYNVSVLQNHSYIKTSISIYYALGDSNSPWYYSNSPSMHEFITLMNESHQYGILANYHGFILLEWHYKGPMLLGKNSTS